MTARPLPLARGGRPATTRWRGCAAHNEPTLAELGGERFEQMRAEALEVLDTDARIPYVRRRGDYLYNFWRDAANPRGLWRRTTLESYPHRRRRDWDVVIDVDELARADDENWVWAGADVIEPDHSLALISLSRGGSDAAVVREFDMRTREFVDDGFELPEAKSQISWEDEDTVLVGTDFGEGSLTESGYPRLVKRWRRGHAARRRRDALQRDAGRRPRRGVGGPHTRLRTHADQPRAGLLQRRGLRAARRRADPDRHPDRRQHLDSSQLAADRAAHRLALQLRDGLDDLPGRFPARRRLRRIPLRAQQNCT